MAGRMTLLVARFGCGLLTVMLVMKTIRPPPAARTAGARRCGRAAEQRLDASVPLRLHDRLERARGRTAGVDDEQIEAAEPVDGLAHDPLRGGGVGDIRRDPCDALGRAGTSAARDSGHPDVGVVRRHGVQPIQRATCGRCGVPRQVASRGREAFGVPCDEDDGCALSEKLQCDRATEAPACREDERDAAIEPEVHAMSSVACPPHAWLIRVPA